jgi:hypothetical protein
VLIILFRMTIMIKRVNQPIDVPGTVSDHNSDTILASRSGRQDGRMARGLRRCRRKLIMLDIMIT